MLLTYTHQLAKIYKEDIKENVSDYPKGCENLAEHLRGIADKIDEMVQEDNASGIVRCRSEIMKEFALGYEALYMLWMKYNLTVDEYKIVCDKLYNQDIEIKEKEEINFDEMEF